MDGSFMFGVHHVQERVAHVLPPALRVLHPTGVFPLLCGRREGCGYRANRAHFKVQLSVVGFAPPPPPRGESKACSFGAVGPAPLVPYHTPGSPFLMRCLSVYRQAPTSSVFAISSVAYFLTGQLVLHNFDYRITSLPIGTHMYDIYEREERGGPHYHASQAVTTYVHTSVSAVRDLLHAPPVGFLCLLGPRIPAASLAPGLLESQLRPRRSLPVSCRGLLGVVIERD